ncbi:DNA topology modulation protein FlaR [Bacillus sp. FJAT-27245]|uniref:DNA topology modulation protein FlaR n=1 Tax=Bacillus sp. FJAT-27245 TaxID=1684144 RepID=UPI0006A77407|nr:DNA topology modulation protein FlaR [Bacillus sp. FJAT-27245]
MLGNAINRIRIIGSVGSGKTTLARKLSDEWNIPYFELDNVVWQRNPAGDRRRTEEERAEYLDSILKSEAWIIEGVHNEEWTEGSFREADAIVFLDPAYSVRTFRIIKRFILQKLGREKAHYKVTYEILIKMFKWNMYFEQNGKPNFFKNYSLYTDKIIILKNNRQLKKFMDK